MKKILIILVMFFCFPIFSKAVDYDIKNYYIDAEVLKNGDMEVKELIVLKGTFNGYERDLIYQNNLAKNELINASDITDISVKAKYVSDVSFNTFNEDFDIFNEVVVANNGDKQKYILSNLTGGYRIRMYYETESKKTAFLIKYTIKDAVVMHAEFAEVYWTFIGDDYADDIRDLQIKLTLPGVDETNYFRIWAHGDLNGEVSFNNTSTNSGLMATSKLVKAYTPTDVRATFSKSLVNEALIKKHSSETIDEILATEQVLADKQNELRTTAKKKYYFACFLTGTFFLYTIISAIYVYKKYDKERKPDFYLEYNREFIDDYNVEVIDYLMNKNITENALSASLMNMIYKKNISYEEVPGEKNNYTFYLINRDNLNETENMLIDFLFVKVGNGNTFSTKELKKYASSTKTCETFMNSFTRWKNQVRIDGIKEEFYETNKNYIWFSFLSLLFSGGILIYLTVNNIEFLIGYLTPFVAIIYFIYTLAFNKRTKKGVEHYARWKAFKKFLNDFGDFSVKELPEIVLWERYLVYATIFGLADKLEKTMNVKIKEIGPYDMIDGMYMYHNHMVNLNIANSISSSIHSAVSSSQATITRMAAQSSASSGSGFGGGFSSGGGFGGGGGGGRGF